MTAVTVYVPCDVVRVRIQLGYGNQLSPIEKVMLKAIAKRPGGVGVEELVNLFKLSERVTLDMLGDLLRRRYVVLDFRNAKVRLEQSVKPDKLDDLKSAERFNDYTDLMVDRLVGSVLPVGDGLSRVDDPRFEIPVVTSAPRDKVTEAELLAVLNQAITQDTHNRSANGSRRRAHRVLAARLSPEAVPDGQVHRRWLPLEVTVRYDDDAGRLRFTVPDRQLSLTRRELVAERLSQLANSLEESRFSQTLRGVAEHRRVEPPALPDLLNQFVKHSNEAATAGAGTRTRRHGDLTREYHQVINALRDRRDSEVTARPVVGTAAHQDVIVQLITTAREQVVLACPALRYDVFLSYYEPIEQALANGVQVVLVWGRDREARLEKPVRNALSDLQWHGGGTERSRQRLIMSSMPSRINAAVVVADDRRALVTGYHFLGDAVADRQQLGVDVVAPRAEPCLLVESILDWARRALRHQQARLMHVRRSDFAAAQPDDEQARRWPDAEVAKPPDPPPDDDRDELAASRVLAWGDRWQDIAGQLRRLEQSGTLPRATLVEDNTHRELFWDAVRRPGKRLLISGRMLHPDVLDERLAAAFRERADDGTEITILHQKSTSAGTGRDASGLLHELKATMPLTVERQPTNARALATDDDVTITSFDFLGSIGHASGARYRGQGELGLHLTGRSIADQIVRFLGLPVAESLPSPTTVPDQPDPATRATQQMLDALAATQPADRPGVVAEQMAMADDPWPVLADLERVGTPVDVLRAAAAVALRYPAARRTSQGQHWLDWLFADRWSNRAFVEAAVLRTEILDPARPPRPELAVVAAARGGPATGRAIVNAWDDDEQVTLAVVATVEILIHDGDLAHGDLISQEVPWLLSQLTVPEPFAGLVAATSEYWSGTTAALPVAAILADNSRTEQRQNIDGDWRRLAEAIERAQTPQTGFERTHRYLFGPDGAFGHLADAVPSRDSGAVRAWLAGDGAIDGGTLVDRATDIAAPGNLPVHGHRRIRYVDRLNGIVRAAQRLAPHAGLLNEATADHRLKPAKAFAAELSAMWPQLRESMLDGPEHVLLTAALDDIEFITRWGNHG